MARKGNYLFQRKGSQNWHLRLQYPTAAIRSAAAALLGREVPKKIEKSLGTPDRRQAEVIAGPDILEHKRFLLAFNHIMKPTGRPLPADGQRVVDAAYMTPLHQKITIAPFEPLHAPGSTIRADDGSMIIATDKDLIHLDATGGQTKIVPNVKVPDKITFGVTNTPAPPASFWRAKTVKSQDIDTEIVENWIKDAKPAGTHERSARNMLALFKELHPSRTFVTAEREDVDAMIDHMKAEKNVSSTIKTKLSTIVAAINHEMAQKKPRVRFNVFAGVAKRDPKDATARLPLTEKDVAAMEARFDLFNEEERLLWTWCVNTGMRPKEVYDLREEHRETYEVHPITGKPSDIRYVWIDKSKNLESTRRIPIPSAVRALRPDEISGPMFTEKLDRLCERINDKMRTAGITSPDPDTGKERKLFYSTRHRVKDRLADADCPADVRKAIMGHKKAPHDGYGNHYPLWKTKPWVEYLNPTSKRPPSIAEAITVE